MSVRIHAENKGLKLTEESFVWSESTTVISQALYDNMVTRNLLSLIDLKNKKIDSLENEINIERKRWEEELYEDGLNPNIVYEQDNTIIEELKNQIIKLNYELIDLKKCLDVVFT